MKERPVLFSAPMVRALLAGTKTQTRRVMKEQPVVDGLFWRVYGAGWSRRLTSVPAVPGHSLATNCPYGQTGDRLWVRETFGRPWHHGQPRFFYRASDDDSVGNHPDFDGWKPSIHMPRAASRILLQITDVRVERLQDISEADAEAEGCERLDVEREERDWKLCPQCGGTRLHNGLGPNGGVIFDLDCTACDTYAKRYRHLWEAINGPGSWDANPWVWCISFKRVEE
ncbi:hypothetical protein BUE93_22225 [Chromobacterium amazonense]|uniref:Morphogenetic protein n=1 Tax=Chromobacterium amazonense TaxID=1382803 RepID=A0A2S9WYB9_9NEIS|nr:hypothetical protein BUE93_22225 [Chromobacterium amazonense]